MKWCSCGSDKYRWRDVACINGKYFKVDEEVVMLDNGSFDIEPIYDKLSEEHNVSVDDIVLASFEKGAIELSVIDKILEGKYLGGYCSVCGGEV